MKDNYKGWKITRKQGNDGIFDYSSVIAVNLNRESRPFIVRDVYGNIFKVIDEIEKEDKVVLQEKPC